MRGRTLRRGEEGYEEARRAAVWNARTPERFPDLIVRAESEEDVVEAVRLAGAEGMRIGVRSGGHSWAGNHLRDGGMLLDVSRLDEVDDRRRGDDRDRRPGRRGNELLGRARRARPLLPGRPLPGRRRSAATCCRAASAGTAASTDRPA